MNAPKKIKDFENYWDEICKKIETTEMSRNDARIWDLEFELDKMRTQMSLNRIDLNNEVYIRLKRVGHKVDLAILKAKANFRRSEKIRLANTYGLLGPIVYVLKTIFGKI